LLRTEAAQKQPERFRQLLEAGAAEAHKLEDALRTGTGSDAAADAFQAVSDNCKTCHREFRDVPLSERMPAR